MEVGYEGQYRVQRAELVKFKRAPTDYRSLFLNYELLLAIREPGLCAELEQQFFDDLRESLPITPANWAKRCWPGRILEAFGWMMRRWL